MTLFIAQRILDEAKCRPATDAPIWSRINDGFDDWSDGWQQACDPEGEHGAEVLVFYRLTDDGEFSDGWRYLCPVVMGASVEAPAGTFTYLSADDLREAMGDHAYEHAYKQLHDTQAALTAYKPGRM